SSLLSPLSSLLSPLSFLLSPISAQSHDYKFRHLTTDQGLTSNNVYVVLKDADGFMWFTTNMGMCRYDGYTMKQFTSDPTDSTSLSGNFLYAEPLVDRSGNIWIGTFESGLSLFDRITGKFTHYKHDPRVNGSIDNNNIWSVYQDSDGVIWVGTYSALNKFDPVTGKFKFFRPSPDHEEDPVNRIYSMLEDLNRDLWIATGRGVFLYNRDTGVFRRFDPASPLTEKLNEQMVFHVMCDNDGDYWFAAEGGLFHYKIKNKELNLFSTQGTGGRTLSGRGVYHVLQDPLDAGIIWITSMWGLNRLNKETGTVEWILNDPDDPFSIGSNTINWTYIDETGKLWVATENAGVAVADLADMHSKDQFFFVPIHPAAPDTIGYSATTFLSDPSGDTWVGTAGGGLYRYDAHLALQSVFMGDQQDHDLLKNAYVFDLFIDPHSNFLIGTYGQGLYIFDTMDHLLTPCSFYPSDTSWMKTYIHDILEDKEGVLWVGTKSGLYYCTENIRTHHALALFDHTDLSVTEVMSFQADQSGRLWTGTAGKGLFCIPEEVNGKNTILHFEHDPEDPQSISSNVILCVYQDDKGILWIGTDRGLNRYTGSNEAFKTYLFPDDPAINFITALREDHNGHLWLETEAGLVRFDPEVPGKNYRIFTLRDGLPLINTTRIPCIEVQMVRC
ncbi:MAG TPA: two-component regulator propeller domain-containing protein, partial [Bacteroidales bacterium]|nr:two-component regulator propeller domain-containing protein [Bacteroidales bacterium]